MQMTTQQNNNPHKPFWEHVADLRRLLFFVVVLLIGTASVIHYFRHDIIPYLLRPLGTDTAPLQFLSPLEPLFFILKIDFVGAIILILPIIIVCIYQFINPTPWRKCTVPLITIISSSLLALAGAAYAYFVIVPIVLGFMNSLIIPGTVAAFTATGFMNFLLGTSFMLVLIFQIPIVTVLGSAVGIINPYLFSDYRRNAYLAIFVVTAVITPTTDVITLLLVSLPAIVITEIGVSIGKLFYTKEANAIETPPPQ